VRDALPDVEGFDTHYGADVFHCPTCDGYEAEGRQVTVFGWTAQVAGFALELLDWAAEVTVVTNGQRFEGGEARRRTLARHGVDVREDDAVELVGPRGNLQGVRLADGDHVECQLVFFSIAHHPSTRLATQLGCDLDGDGHVWVDECNETSVAGVYAAGDLAPGLQLIQVAAAQGATAGTRCALSLRGEPGASDAPAPGPDVESELARDGACP
jgi:thioredoxin reductase